MGCFVMISCSKLRQTGRQKNAEQKGFFRHSRQLFFSIFFIYAFALYFYWFVPNWNYFIPFPHHSYDTETTHRYRPSESQQTTRGPSIANLALQETYQSNVFRNGDWNVTGHPSERYSVTRNDFHVKPFVSEEKPER